MHMDKQYDAMALATLRELAKSKGLKGITALRKQELINTQLMDNDRVLIPSWMNNN